MAPWVNWGHRSISVTCIGLTVTSSNGQSLSVVEDADFPSSYFGDVACIQVANTLTPAVQNLIGKIVRHPYFSLLIRR